MPVRTKRYLYFLKALTVFRFDQCLSLTVCVVFCVVVVSGVRPRPVCGPHLLQETQISSTQTPGEEETQWPCIYVRDPCKIRTILKPSDSFEAGQTVLQLLISTTDGFKAVQTDEQLSWTVPKLCIKCTAARFSYIFMKIHVVQCATPPVLVIFS